MRVLGYFCVAALLSAAPWASAVRAAGEQPLGVIEATQDGHLDGTEAEAGSDFYAGEEFVTYESGAMQLRVHHCRIDLGASTQAQFLPDESPDRLQVIQGSARYSCPKGAALWIETPAGILRGVPGLESSGMVTINDSHNLVVSAYGQTVVLDNDGELHIINPGQTYRVAVSMEEASANANVPPQVQKKRRRRKLAMWLIGGSMTAFAVGEIWEQDSESPYKPKSDQSSSALLFNP
jgi:hypothetical protein